MHDQEKQIRSLGILQLFPILCPTIVLEDCQRGHLLVSYSWARRWHTALVEDLGGGGVDRGSARRAWRLGFGIFVVGRRVACLFIWKE